MGFLNESNILIWNLSGACCLTGKNGFFDPSKQLQTFTSSVGEKLGQTALAVFQGPKNSIFLMSSKKNEWGIFCVKSFIVFYVD